MTVNSQPILAEYSFVSEATKDLDVFAHLLVLGLNPRFFGPGHDKIVVSTIGSFFAKKSRIADQAALQILPEFEGQFFLSGYNDDMDPPLVYRGRSPVFDFRTVELTFEDPTYDKIPEDVDNMPGIRFIQNVLPEDIQGLWLSLEVRSPMPPPDELEGDPVIEASRVLSGTATQAEIADYPVRDASRTVKLFNYAAAGLLRARNLEKAYNLISNRYGAEPLTITLRVHDPRLMEDSFFQRFMNVMDMCADRPTDAPNLLTEGLSGLISSFD